MNQPFETLLSEEVVVYKETDHHVLCVFDGRLLEEKRLGDVQLEVCAIVAQEGLETRG